MRLTIFLFACFAIIVAGLVLAAPISYPLRVNPNMLYEDGSTIPSTAVIQYRIYYGDCITLPTGQKTMTLAPGVSTWQEVSNDGDPQSCIYASQIVDGIESGVYTKTPYTVPARPIPKKKPAPPAGVSRITP